METINKQTNWINIIVLTKRKLSTNYCIKFQHHKELILLCSVFLLCNFNICLFRITNAWIRL